MAKFEKDFEKYSKTKKKNLKECISKAKYLIEKKSSNINANLTNTNKQLNFNKKQELNDIEDDQSNFSNYSDDDSFKQDNTKKMVKKDDKTNVLIYK